MINSVQNSKPLHEVMTEVLWNCSLQTASIDVGIPFICGAPGGGKTASIHHLCNIYDNFEVISTHLALKPIEETGGIPQFDNIMINGRPVLGTIWSFPDIMKLLYELYEKKKHISNLVVIWLLDDSHLLGPVHMALLYELFTERTLRGYQIPEKCAMVMAGNTSSKSGAKSMFSAIVNRCVMMPVHTDFNGWKNNFAIGNNIHPGVISFLGNVQYQKFFHEEEQVDTAWGSPRSWTRFSNEITSREDFYNKTISSDLCLYLGSGYVGKEAASEFVAYYKIYSEFDINNILTNYQYYQLPSEPVKSYALAYALTTAYIGKSDRDKFIPGMSHLVSLFMREASELSIMIIKELKQAEKTLSNIIVKENDKKEKEAKATKTIFVKKSTKVDMVQKIINQIQKTEPALIRETLKDVIDLTSDMGE